MEQRRNRTPVRPKGQQSGLYMKRSDEERRGKSSTQEVEEREQKRQREVEPTESENTGGASSSWEHRSPEEVDDQPAESAKNKSVPNPKGPSRKEREEHEETHCTYRSWCKHCIMGRGMNSPDSQTKDHDQDSITTISLDYGYMKKKRGEAISDSDGMPIVFMMDRMSKIIKSFVVPKKGIHPYAIKKVVEALNLLGYKRLKVKNAIRRLP